MNQKYLKQEFNYDKYPTTKIKGYDNEVYGGYDAIVRQLQSHTEKGQKHVLLVDCNTAVDVPDLKSRLVSALNPDEVFETTDIFLDNDTIQNMLKRHVTDDRVFGVLYNGTWKDFVDPDGLSALQQKVEKAQGLVLVIGIAAHYIAAADTLVYADMTIWETQMRYRSGRVSNFAIDNPKEDFIRKFKRGYFIDWRLNNRHKQEIFNAMDYYLDTVVTEAPAMITREAFDEGLLQLMQQPFRTVPFFDEGLWGGQWMREVCGVEDDSKPNFAWSYNLLFQENEVNLTFGDVRVNVPGYTVCLRYPRELIGEKGYARFGAEYPIRYDFLDTVEGGNLSFQVHPTTQYIQENFGMHYTQDESYYYLDVVEDKDCVIYLGLKTGVDKEEFAKALYEAQKGVAPFPDEKFVNKIPVKKHEHYQIPAGTVHCSGADTMVLEISSSPCIFTFKMWDWGRVGLDGIPRPVHLEHGLANVQFDRQTDWIMETCAFKPVPIREGDGFREEKTGLNDLQFIETRRTWATKKYTEKTNNETNALHLVEGAEALIESPIGQFDPFVIHYAESVVIPACISEYTVRPYGKSEGKEIAVLNTFVRY